VKYTICLLLSALLTGCPSEDNTVYCEKISVCEEESEMICNKNDSGCGEDCHYYVVEHCWEECKDESR